MKKLIQLPVVAIIAVLTFASCSKDNFVEFYSTGEWRLDRYYLSGTDNTDTYLESNQDYQLNLQTGHDFTETASINGAPYGVTGTWEVTNDATILRLYDDFNGTREYQIVYTSAATLKIKKGAEQWDLKRP